ncbi:DUF4890 domain-containing protein [Microbacter margulisiae]|uniref:Phage I-like protein n=1 Tax=Microbacter margulisiae TaxID=1350067 RepID=A0A7W5H1H4_9PORP|nr:DUF4890 domain-containing protein [Microbacter margulisiae]MBB3186366.1 phage I-like protein [Microbacter margulisiae]
MKTKRFLTFMVLFAALSMGAAFAQGFNSQLTPEQRAKQMTERMKKQLNLTDDQVAKIDSVNLKFAQDMMKARESGDMRSAMRTCIEEQNTALKAILTPDQMKTWEDARKAMMERMHQMRDQGNN